MGRPVTVITVRVNSTGGEFMSGMLLCGGCQPGHPVYECYDAFARIGVDKVHLELQAFCNLDCPWCYRDLPEEKIDRRQAKMSLRY